MKYSLSLLFGVCCSSMVMANSSSDYLNKTVDAYLAHRSQNPVGQMSTFNRWFEDAEVRLQQDDDSKTAYQLRLQPKSLAQTRAEQKLLDQQGKLNQLKRQQQFAVFLKRHYHQLINLIANKATLDLLQQQQHLVADKIKFYRSQAGGDAFQPEKLQTVILKRDALQQQIDNQSPVFLAQCQNLGIEPLDLALQHYVIPTEIINRPVDIKQHAEIATLRIELNRLQKNRDRNHARTGLGLSFIQLEHENSRNNNSNAISVGIRIPLGKQNFSDLQQAYQHNDLQAELSEKTLSLNDNIAQLKLELKTLLSTYAQQQTHLSDIDKQLHKKHKTPMVALRLLLKQRQLVVREQINTTHIKLLRRMIDYLYATGLLTSSEQNWLLPELSAQ